MQKPRRETTVKTLVRRDGSKVEGVAGQIADVGRVVVFRGEAQHIGSDLYPRDRHRGLRDFPGRRSRAARYLEHPPAAHGLLRFPDHPGLFAGQIRRGPPGNPVRHVAVDLTQVVIRDGRPMQVLRFQVGRIRRWFPGRAFSRSFTHRSRNAEVNLSLVLHGEVHFAGI